MRSGANATQLRLILVSRVCRSVLFFLVAGVIAAPEHQECILAAVMDDITRKSTSTPGAGTGPARGSSNELATTPTASNGPGDHSTRHSGPATIKLVNLPLLTLGA
jgi:hypothetical protein